MKVHYREHIVKDAELILFDAISRVYKLNLTYGEKLRVFSEVFGSAIARIAECVIIEERHGDQNKPGGL